RRRPDKCHNKIEVGIAQHRQHIGLDDAQACQHTGPRDAEQQWRNGLCNADPLLPTQRLQIQNPFQ
ncbi:hypothetical protein HAX54_021248, partial [Datura stramonium]|nr:hypothetical protein [Datura stramonium]